MEPELGGEQPYPKAQRLRAEGKSVSEIVDALMASGVSRPDAQFVINSLPGGALSRFESVSRPGEFHADGTANGSLTDDPQQGAQSNRLPGWVWFVLVYGVGNVILYSTTGILLIPIPRK